MGKGGKEGLRGAGWAQNSDESDAKPNATQLVGKQTRVLDALQLLRPD